MPDYRLFYLLAILIGVLVFLLGFLVFVGNASANSLLYETSGTLQEPYAKYGGNGLQITLENGTATYIETNIATENNSQDLGFQFGNGVGAWVDCRTEIKSGDQWGIENTNFATSTGEIVYFPLFGTQCNNIYISAPQNGLYAVSALNIQQSFNSGYYFWPASIAGGDPYLKIYSGDLPVINLPGVIIDPIPTPQYIEILNPSYGTTTSTNTINFIIRFQTPPSIDFRPTTTRRYTVYDAVSNDLEYQYNVTINPNSSENVVVNQLVDLTDGSKIVHAGYYTENGGLYSEQDELFFNVATNTFLIATGLENPNATGGGLTQNDCTLFDVGCQFQKAIVFLFYPSSNILDKFSNLWQTIETKKPFGYVTVTIDAFSNLEIGQAAFDFGQLPFMTTIFEPVRNGIAALLWIVYSVYFYRNRLVKLDI